MSLICTRTQCESPYRCEAAQHAPHSAAYSESINVTIISDVCRNIFMKIFNTIQIIFYIFQMVFPFRLPLVEDRRLKPGTKKAAGGVIGGAGMASQHGTTFCWSRYNSRWCFSQRRRRRMLGVNVFTFAIKPTPPFITRSLLV